MRWTVAVLLPSLVLAGCEADNAAEPASNLPATIVAIPDTTVAVGDTLRVGAPADRPKRVITVTATDTHAGRDATTFAIDVAWAMA